MAYSETGTTKDQKQRPLKSHNSLDEITEEGSESDSKTDSDKIVTVVPSSNSIYANQRQRSREAAAAFQRKLQELRKSKGISGQQPASFNTPQSKIPTFDIRPTSAAGTAEGGDQNGAALAQLSYGDSGYLTRKEAASSGHNDSKHSMTIPPGKSSHIPRPKGQAECSGSAAPNWPQTPFLSPISQSDDYFTINGHQYRILNQIGKGGSSQVYQVYDEERKLCLAVKRVDLSEADDMVVTAYRNEIALLKRLQQYPNRVVRMYDYEYLENEQRLYVVMEKGDTDLASLFKSRQNDKLPDQMVAFYWLEMLKAVQVIHKEGIVHSDLKPANFLLVAGNLKLIDFGIANAVPSNKTSVTRECQMGTLNYMSPEAVSYVDSGGLNDMKLRVSIKSDVWSLGCILYNMVYGKTPFQDIRNPMAKMTAVMNRKHLISYSPVADSAVIDVMKRCLERDPKRRAYIDELLEHSYLKTYHGSGTPAATDTGVSDANLRTLAETISKTTPRTGARLIKAAMEKMQSAQSDTHQRGTSKK